MLYVKFGFDNLSHFPSRAQTHAQTKLQMEMITVWTMCCL